MITLKGVHKRKSTMSDLDQLLKKLDIIKKDVNKIRQSRPPKKDYVRSRSPKKRDPVSDIKNMLPESKGGQLDKGIDVPSKESAPDNSEYEKMTKMLAQLGRSNQKEVDSSDNKVLLQQPKAPKKDLFSGMEYMDRKIPSNIPLPVPRDYKKEVDPAIAANAKNAYDVLRSKMSYEPDPTKVNVPLALPEKTVDPALESRARDAYNTLQSKLAYEQEVSPVNIPERRVEPNPEAIDPRIIAKADKAYESLFSGLEYDPKKAPPEEKWRQYPMPDGEPVDAAKDEYEKLLAAANFMKPKAPTDIPLPLTMDKQQGEVPREQLGDKDPVVEPKAEDPLRDPFARPNLKSGKPQDAKKPLDVAAPLGNDDVKPKSTYEDLIDKVDKLKLKYDEQKRDAVNDETAAKIAQAFAKFGAGMGHVSASRAAGVGIGKAPALKFDPLTAVDRIEKTRAEELKSLTASADRKHKLDREKIGDRFKRDEITYKKNVRTDDLLRKAFDKEETRKYREQRDRITREDREEHRKGIKDIKSRFGDIAESKLKNSLKKQISDAGEKAVTNKQLTTLREDLVKLKKVGVMSDQVLKGNKLARPALGAMLARYLEGNAKMTDQDVIRYISVYGLQGWTNAVSEWINGNLKPESIEDIDLFSKAIVGFSEEAIVDLVAASVVRTQSSAGDELKNTVSDTMHDMGLYQAYNEMIPKIEDRALKDVRVFDAWKKAKTKDPNTIDFSKYRNIMRHREYKAALARIEGDE